MLTSNKLNEFVTAPGDDSVTMATTLEMFLDVSYNVVSVCKSLSNLSE